MIEIRYNRVCFASLTPVWGFRVNTLTTRDNIGLVRLIGDGRDDLEITKPGKPTGHVPWSRISFAEPTPEAEPKAPAVKKARGKAEAE